MLFVSAERLRKVQDEQQVQVLHTNRVQEQAEEIDDLDLGLAVAGPPRGTRGTGLSYEVDGKHMFLLPLGLLDGGALPLGVTNGCGM